MITNKIKALFIYSVLGLGLVSCSEDKQNSYNDWKIYEPVVTKRSGEKVPIKTFTQIGENELFVDETLDFDLERIGDWQSAKLNLTASCISQDERLSTMSFSFPLKASFKFYEFLPKAFFVSPDKDQVCKLKFVAENRDALPHRFEIESTKIKKSEEEEVMIKIIANNPSEQHELLDFHNFNDYRLYNSSPEGEFVELHCDGFSLKAEYNQNNGFDFSNFNLDNLLSRTEDEQDPLTYKTRQSCVLLTHTNEEVKSFSYRFEIQTSPSIPKVRNLFRPGRNYEAQIMRRMGEQIDILNTNFENPYPYVIEFDVKKPDFQFLQVMPFRQAHPNGPNDVDYLEVNPSYTFSNPDIVEDNGDSWSIQLNPNQQINFQLRPTIHFTCEDPRTSEVIHESGFIIESEIDQLEVQVFSAGSFNPQVVWSEKVISPFVVMYSTHRQVRMPEGNLLENQMRCFLN